MNFQVMYLNHNKRKLEMLRFFLKMSLINSLCSQDVNLCEDLNKHHIYNMSITRFMNREVTKKKNFLFIGGFKEYEICCSRFYF